MNYYWFKYVTFAVGLANKTAREAANKMPCELRTLAKVLFTAKIAKFVKNKKVKLTKM